MSATDKTRKDCIDCSQPEICAEYFENLGKQMTEAITKLDTLNKRIFVDNGTESIQSRINRLDNEVKTAKGLTKWIFTSIVGNATVVAFIIWIVVKFAHETGMVKP